MASKAVYVTYQGKHNNSSNINRKDTSNADLWVLIEGKTFSLPRNVICSSCAYLNNISLCGDKPNDPIKCQDITLSSFECIIDSFYTGTFTVDVNRLPEMYECAKKLEMDDISKWCESTMIENITSETAVSYRNVAWEHELFELRQKSMKYTISNISSVFGNQKINDKRKSWLCLKDMRDVEKMKEKYEINFQEKYKRNPNINHHGFSNGCSKDEDQIGTEEKISSTKAAAAKPQFNKTSAVKPSIYNQGTSNGNIATGFTVYECQKGVELLSTTKCATATLHLEDKSAAIPSHQHLASSNKSAIHSAEAEHLKEPKITRNNTKIAYYSSKIHINTQASVTRKTTQGYSNVTKTRLDQQHSDQQIQLEMKEGATDLIEKNTPRGDDRKEHSTVRITEEKYKGTETPTNCITKRMPKQRHKPHATTRQQNVTGMTMDGTDVMERYQSSEKPLSDVEIGKHQLVKPYDDKHKATKMHRSIPTYNIKTNKHDIIAAYGGIHREQKQIRSQDGKHVSIDWVDNPVFQEEDPADETMVPNQIMKEEQSENRYTIINEVTKQKTVYSKVRLYRKRSGEEWNITVRTESKVGDSPPSPPILEYNFGLHGEKYNKVEIERPKIEMPVTELDSGGSINGDLYNMVTNPMVDTRKKRNAHMDWYSRVDMDEHRHIIIDPDKVKLSEQDVGEIYEELSPHEPNTQIEMSIVLDSKVIKDCSADSTSDDLMMREASSSNATECDKGSTGTTENPAGNRVLSCSSGSTWYVGKSMFCEDDDMVYDEIDTLIDTPLTETKVVEFEGRQDDNVFQEEWKGINIDTVCYVADEEQATNEGLYDDVEIKGTHQEPNIMDNGEGSGPECLYDDIYDTKMEVEPTVVYDDINYGKTDVVHDGNMTAQIESTDLDGGDSDNNIDEYDIDGSDFDDDYDSLYYNSEVIRQLSSVQGGRLDDETSDDELYDTVARPTQDQYSVSGDVAIALSVGGLQNLSEEVIKIHDGCQQNLSVEATKSPVGRQQNLSEEIIESLVGGQQNLLEEVTESPVGGQQSLVEDITESPVGGQQHLLEEVTESPVGGQQSLLEEVTESHVGGQQSLLEEIAESLVGGHMFQPALDDICESLPQNISSQSSGHSVCATYFL